MDLIFINTIFAIIHGFTVVSFGQRQLLRIHNIKRLKKVAKMPGGKKKVIQKKIGEMNLANRKLEKIGHLILFLIMIANFITLYFNYYQRFRFWWGMIVIWLVFALFLRIAFWLKGATIISHIDIEDNGDYDWD
ncbi:MAG: hypothetical protein ABJG68_03545 [Crocinitomicaceae bacterium]